VTVLVSVRGGPFAGVSRREVRTWAERMMEKLDLVGAELSIALTGDGEIRRLNRSFRGFDKPTDVLAFAMREGPLPPGGAPLDVLGDVIVSVETARRQAAARDRSLHGELQLLLAHGLLHLLGYDHQTPAEARRMAARTRQLCRAAQGEARAGARKPMANGRGPSSGRAARRG
jgi:probable rRNA maturation factor